MAKNKETEQKRRLFSLIRTHFSMMKGIYFAHFFVFCVIIYIFVPN